MKTKFFHFKGYPGSLLRLVLNPNFLTHFILFLAIIFSTELSARKKLLIKVDFELKKGLILFQASANDQQGWFILDSGAPSLVLNQKYFCPTHESPASDQLIGLQGQKISARPCDAWTFELGALRRTGTGGFVMDLSYLESKERSLKILGLVGLDVFQGYYVQTCFRTKKLTFAKSKRKLLGKRKFQKIPVKVHGHLQMITLNPTKRPVHFVLDCGSESNILDQAILDTYTFRKPDKPRVKLVSADQESILVNEVHIAPGKLGTRMVDPMTFLVIELHPIQIDPANQINGILGIPFLSRYTLIFDKYKRNILISTAKDENTNQLAITMINVENE